MSLFPAYSEQNHQEKIDENKTVNELSWLENSSFAQNAVQVVNTEKQIEILSDSSDEVSNDIETPKKIKRKKYDKDKTTQKSIDSSQKLQTTFAKDEDKNNIYSVDTTFDKMYLIIPFIPKQNRPKYSILRTYGSKSKREKYFRYFIVGKNLENKKENLSEEDSEKKLEQTQNAAVKQEEDLSKTTAFYNRSLDEDPHDVSLWLKYIRFQDVVYQFEKVYKRGSHVKGARVTAERKLAILDKALTHNPQSEELLRERVLIAERVYPADEMSAMMKSLVDKEPGNIIFWQGYIEATQCSMAHCNTPAVLDMYKKCLSNLHQMRRTAVNNKSEIEAKILNMLYQCGLFLRQAGLWEQLWSLLRLYLELNLANDKNSFNIESTVLEKELLELEDVVLTSNLPSHELWLRIEKLREACHWLPWSDMKNSDECEDPQRLVFTEDVSELIHPITCPGNMFRLTAIIFTLLKVPLLPCRHTTMHELGLDYVPWALDALELLLPMFYPISTISFTINDIFTDMMMLLVGPQYVRSHPGQEEYLTFVLEIVKRCAYNLEGIEQTAIWTWWFAFIRLITILDREQILKLSAITKKQIKTDIKVLLKKGENRNSLIFFREYALIEYEHGNCESAYKILITAIQSQNNTPVTSLEDSLNKASLCLLYRTLAEFLIKDSRNQKENLQKAIGVLICLALGSPITLESTLQSNTQSLEKAFEKFKATTNEILNEEIKKLSPIEHFLPDFITNWIICHGWLLCLVKSPFDSGAFIERIILNHLKQDLFRQEVLFEFYVGILHRHCLESQGSGIYDLLNQVVSRAIKLFPNNLYFLATLTQIENYAGGIGRPWWKVNELLTATNHCTPRLFLIILMIQRMTQYEKAQKLAVEKFGGPYLEDPSYKNRMFSLFHKLTNSNSVSKRCGLIWRLYLKFLYHKSSSDACRNAYYAACEECPWLKALYIDAAIYIPTELPQIQDLLVEKQLRIHLTPEELEIIRN